MNFEKRILIVRDPRDHLVSRLLYRACADPEFRQDDTKVAGFIQALRQKEADPRSISFLGLLDRYNNLRDGGQPQSMTEPTGLPRSWAVGSYPMALRISPDATADFTPINTKTLSPGITRASRIISKPPSAAPAKPRFLEEYEHVARSKASGDWRHWLAQSDIDLFRLYLLPYMRAYGY